MSRIGDSFKREIGKNTGKAVSNLIFGDSHSTPYRRVDRERRTAIAERNAEEKIKRDRKADLNNLNAAVLKNTDIVLQTNIPSDEKALTTLLSMWSAQLETTKWRYSSKEGRIHNQYSNALYGKYCQALIMLKSLFPTNPMVGFFQSSQDKAKRRRILSMILSIWGLYGTLIFTILLYIFLNAIDAIKNKTFETAMPILCSAFLLIVMFHIAYRQDH